MRPLYPETKYSEKENQLIREQYPTHTAKEIALMTGRTEEEIFKKARRTGLTKERLNVNISKVPETTLAYVAGIVDGEGTITIVRQLQRKGQHQPTYWINLQIAQGKKNGFKLANLIETNFGITLTKGYYVKKNYHVILSLCSEKAYAFIKAIEPYLLLKKENAHVAMTFQETRKPYKIRTPEEMTQQENLYLEMKKLNDHNDHFDSLSRTSFLFLSG